MGRVLVVANKTVGGRKLLDAIQARADAGDTDFVLVVPRTRPKHGNVIYDGAARDASEIRIQLARGFLAQQGIEVKGELGDEDPYTAAMDAILDHNPEHVIVSTLPQTRSGWLRRDLVERIRQDAGRDVEHVVTDPEQEGLAVKVTLVVANRTAVSDELFETLKAQHERDEARVFIAVVPLESSDGRAEQEARGRLRILLDRLRGDGLLAAGMVGDPDPYTATMNALDEFTIDQVLISTLPMTKSGWLRGDLISRVQGGTTAHVEHVVSSPEAAQV
jgi:hypothetical protein